MNNKIKAEKFRKLSIASLITGILPYIYMLLLYLILEILLKGVYIIDTLVTSLTFVGFGLPIAAVVCGSIDLKRVKAGRYSNKGKGLDIAGITLGSVLILAVIWFALADAPIFY